MGINGAPATLLHDELDTKFGRGRSDEELRQLIDSGFEQGGVASISAKVDGKREDVDFPAYAPMALAAKMDANYLDPTIRTRSVMIHMQRRAPR